MAERAAVAPKGPAPTPATASCKFVEPETLFERIRQLQESIARRAFELFEGRGAQAGRELDDWFESEAELLHPVHLELTETDDALNMRAEVPGFKAKDLEVSVEPQRVIISGKRESNEQKKTAKAVYTEKCSNVILRVVNLPAEIEPAKTMATLKDGVLELQMPKAPKTKDIPVETKRV